MSVQVELFDGGIKEWTRFIKKKQFLPYVSFQHTWEWAESKRADELEIIRLGFHRDGATIAVGQFIKRPLWFGQHYWIAYRGLCLDYDDEQDIRECYRAAQRYFRRQPKTAFVRFDPDLLRDSAQQQTFRKLGTFSSGGINNPVNAWCVDLQDTEEQQFEWMREHGMKKKMPYYYRRAVRDGVKFRKATTPKDINAVLDQLRTLSERKQFTYTYDTDHIRGQLALMSPPGYEEVFLAEKDGEILASAIVTFFGREVSYVHGASTDNHHELCAPQFLLIEIMKYAKKHHPDIQRMNFWGIVRDKYRKLGSKHPGNGYSDFKRSFGGYRVELMMGQNFVYIFPLYLAFYLLEKYRTKKYRIY